MYKVRHVVHSTHNKQEHENKAADDNRCQNDGVFTLLELNLLHHAADHWILLAHLLQMLVDVGHDTALMIQVLFDAHCNAEI